MEELDSFTDAANPTPNIQDWLQDQPQMAMSSPFGSHRSLLLFEDEGMDVDITREDQPMDVDLTSEGANNDFEGAFDLMDLDPFTGNEDVVRREQGGSTGALDQAFAEYQAHLVSSGISHAVPLLPNSGVVRPADVTPEPAAEADDELGSETATIVGGSVRAHVAEDAPDADRLDSGDDSSDEVNFDDFDDFNNLDDFDDRIDEQLDEVDELPIMDDAAGGSD
ncbi:hypothetical protein EV121DRAFT_297499, partial [Schizophyllum commune]